MSRQEDDAVAGKVGQQVAEADALFGVETDSRLVQDQQLRVVKQRLRDADALPHAAGVAAKRSPGRADQISKRQQFINAPPRRRRVKPLERSDVLQKLHARQVGIHAEVLREVA